MTILALLVSCFQVGVVGAALWCGVCVCVRAHVCVCVGFDLCGSDASTVKYFFYTPLSIQPWRFQCEHIVFFSMRVCVCFKCMSIRWCVSLHSLSDAMTTIFASFIFSSPIFLELSVLWRCPQPPPPPHPHHHHPDPTSKKCLPHGGAVRLLSSEAARRRFSSATNWNRPSVKPSSHPSHLSTIVA